MDLSWTFIYRGSITLFNWHLRLEMMLTIRTTNVQLSLLTKYSFDFSRLIPMIIDYIRYSFQHSLVILPRMAHSIHFHRLKKHYTSLNSPQQKSYSPPLTPNINKRAYPTYLLPILKQQLHTYIQFIQLGMTQQQKQQLRNCNLILELNKQGLSYLKYFQYNQCIEYLKKAEKLVNQELSFSEGSSKVHSLASVTYNNLACYYKKTKKPKVALKYLRKSLHLQVNKINDWISTGSTHLNICAIYSSLNNHEQALGHATLAIELLQMQQKDKSETSKCYWNFKMLCCYNKAIEEEHLKLFGQSVESYKRAKEIAQLQILGNHQIIKICKESIAKIQGEKEEKRRKMAQIYFKKKQQEQKSLLIQKPVQKRYSTIKILNQNKQHLKQTRQIRKVKIQRNHTSVDNKLQHLHHQIPSHTKKYRIFRQKTEPSTNLKIT